MYHSEHVLAESQEKGVHRKHDTMTRKNRVARFILYVILIIAFGLAWWQISVQGYLRAKAYMDQSVNQVRQENARNTKELQERMESLSDEMAQLKESLNNAGSSLSNSAEVQTRIDEKLQKLDKQLKDLEGSLKVLKEAP